MLQFIIMIIYFNSPVIKKKKKAMKIQNNHQRAQC